MPPHGLLVSSQLKPATLIFYLPRLFYLIFSAALAAAVLFKIVAEYSFDTNEGWNAFWASAAWDGSNLYPDPASLKLNNYLPLWSYSTGALGNLVGDNIQAGRILAGTALLLNAAVIVLIVREIAGRGRCCWFAGAAFLTIFGLFYGNYVAINDPQVAANLFMTLSLFLFVRRIDGKSGPNLDYLIVVLMLVGGLLKHNVLAAPVSVAIYLTLYRRSALAHFVAVSAAGGAIICAVLYATFGTPLFSSLLFPREYNLAVALTQTRDQLAQYNVFLLAVPYLLLQTSLQAKFIFIYSIASFIQGLVFTGGADVDVNVFFDFAVAISIGLGLAENSVAEMIEHKTDKFQAGLLPTGWLIFTSLPVILSLEAGYSQVRLAFDALTGNTQQVDLEYVKSTAGDVVCENLAFCYWTGKKFEVDLNNLKTMVWARPALEREFLSRIETCSYALIQLDEDWEDDDGPFTENMIEALKHHYAETRKTESAIYMTPSRCDR
jgi:hypothetical protein